MAVSYTHLDNVYMGNAFMNLRKMEVSKVAPNRAALIGKFNQSMNSDNMSAMKEVEKADKKWLCILFGIPYEAEFQGEGTGSAAHVLSLIHISIVLRKVQ